MCIRRPNGRRRIRRSLGYSPVVKIVDRDGDFNFVLLLTLPLCFVGNAIFEYSTEGAMPLIISTAVSVPCLAALAFILREQLREDAFRAWVSENEGAIAYGNAEYRGLPMTLHSTIYRYRYTYSLLLINVNTFGRPLVEGREDLRGASIGYNAVSALLGWWYLFRGPWITAKVLFSNIRRGPEQMTLEQYIDWMRSSEAPVQVNFPFQ